VVANGVRKDLDVTRLADRVGLALGPWPDAPAPGAVDPEPPTRSP